MTRRSGSSGRPLSGDEVYVTLTYSRLMELLGASEELAEIRNAYAQLSREVLALRQIQQECIERIGEINRYL